ncbi:MAG: hypothetical protein JNM24_04820 [Bdellovibrionaceae bacterium]|nr:hypothetical protein [Pseudobdellovibrionaceae bacterium]
MSSVIRFVMAVIWLALAIGTTDALVDLTKQVAMSAAEAHHKGPMSFGRFSRLLNGTK